MQQEKKGSTGSTFDNLEIIRIHRFSEKKIISPEITVKIIPSTMSLRFPSLSARVPKGSIVASAPRKYPEKSRLEANFPYV